MNPSGLSSPSMVEAVLEWCQRYGHLSPERILLGASEIPPNYRPFVAEQRRSASVLATKLPSWSERGVYIPKGINLEQASGELCALYKSRYTSPEDTLIDMTGGLGVDFVALGRQTSKAIYTEINPETFLAAQYNIPRLLTEHSGIILLNIDSAKALPQLLSTYRPTLLYIDPARREGIQGYKRVYAIEDCSPNLYSTLEIVQQEAIRPLRLLVKLSPMLDITHTLEHLNHVISLEIVSVKGEVKELLLHLDLDNGLPAELVPINCVDLSPSRAPIVWGGRLSEELNSPSTLCTRLGNYLYEPNGAVMKSGLYRLLGQDFSLEKLDTSTHLYTGDRLHDDFPGRVYEIIEEIPFHSSTLKQLAKRLPQAMIATRNFPLSTAELRKRLKCQDAGTHTLWGVRYNGVATLLLCSRYANGTASGSNDLRQ